MEQPGHGRAEGGDPLAQEHGADDVPHHGLAGPEGAHEQHRGVPEEHREAGPAAGPEEGVPPPPSSAARQASLSLSVLWSLEPRKTSCTVRAAHTRREWLLWMAQGEAA